MTFYPKYKSKNQFSYFFPFLFNNSCIHDKIVKCYQTLSEKGRKHMGNIWEVKNCYKDIHCPNRKYFFLFWLIGFRQPAVAESHQEVLRIQSCCYSTSKRSKTTWHQFFRKRLNMCQCALQERYFSAPDMYWPALTIFSSLTQTKIKNLIGFC